MIVMCWMISQQHIPYHLSSLMIYWGAQSAMFSSSDMWALGIFFMGWVFSTYMLQAYFTLCFRHNGFLFMRIRFSWPIRLGHILSCASTMVDFSLPGWGFFDSYTSGIFYFIPLLWRVFIIFMPFIWCISNPSGMFRILYLVLSKSSIQHFSSL